MILTRKTLMLAGGAAALFGLNFLDSGNTYSTDDALPGLPAMPADSITRMEVSSASAKTILVQEDGLWQVTAPFEAKADQALIGGLLSTFRKETTADVRVDQGNLEDYGLDATSVTIGYDAPGGASFVRLSGDDAVYRMRVGGRHRYDMPPIAWRNRVLLDYVYTTAAAIEIDQADSEPIRFVRGASPGLSPDGTPIPGSWSMDPPVTWQIDQYRVEAMVRALGLMRAGGLLGSDFEGAFSQPRATITVTLDDGTRRQMIVSSRRQGSAGFVQVGLEAFQVTASRLDLALQPKMAFQDLTIFAFAREEVDTVTLEQGAARVILQQTGGGDHWNVLQPENFDIDPKLVYFAVNTLRELRGVTIADATLEQAGLLDPGARITARLLDGREMTLELGNYDGEGRVFVRRSDSARVYTVLPETLEKLRRGFGRGGG